jgi:hypothetical protein
MIISHSVLCGMRDVSDIICSENQNTLIFSKKSCCLLNMWKNVTVLCLIVKLCNGFAMKSVSLEHIQ